MNPLLAAAKYVSRPLDIMMNDVPPSQNVYEEQLRVEDQIARQKIAVNQQKQLPKSTNVQETPRDEFSTAENIKEVKVDSLQEQSDRDMALALSIQMDQEEEARRDASRIMLSENTVPPEDNVPKDSKDKASCLLM